MKNLKNQNIAFIGGGTMSEAIVKSLLNKNTLLSKSIYVNDNKKERAKELADIYKINTSFGDEGKAGLLAKANILVLAVKPEVATKALEYIKDKIKPETILISIVAGLTLGIIKSVMGERKIIRAMPNTPLAVGEGMTAITPNEFCQEADILIAEELFAAGGLTLRIKESELDAVTALSGSGPAYAFLIIEALADGGVAMGIARDKALLLAAQTLKGATALLLGEEPMKSPAVYKDKVTSPAGTTIAGLRVLERAGVRSAMIEAVVKATERAREL